VQWARQDSNPSALTALTRDPTQEHSVAPTSGIVPTGRRADAVKRLKVVLLSSQGADPGAKASWHSQRLLAHVDWPG